MDAKRGRRPLYFQLILFRSGFINEQDKPVSGIVDALLITIQAGLFVADAPVPAGSRATGSTAKYLVPWKCD